MCCYCNTFNPARKQRSHAPKLPQLNHSSDSSESDTSILTEASISKELENCIQKKDEVLANEGIMEDNDRGSNFLLGLGLGLGFCLFVCLFVC